MERLAADAPLGRVQQRGEAGVGQLDPLALLVRDRAEFQIGVVQLAERLRRGLGHFGLHGQQLLFLLAERVRLESQQPLEHEPVRGELGRRPDSVLILALGMARISGRMKLAAWPARLAALT